MEWKHTYNALKKMAGWLVYEYRQLLERDNINASFKLSDSARYYIDYEDQCLEVSLELQDYWKYIENGTEPGHFPPRDKILEWISVKPVIPRPSNNGRIPTPEQLAFLISRKIFEEGTDAKPVLKESIDDVMAEFDQVLSDAVTQDISESLDEVLILFK